MAAIDREYPRRRKLARRLRGVYALTPELSDTDVLVARVAAALAGGASAIQYRNKQLGKDARVQQASALAPLVKHHNALFIVNDDAAIAAEVDADGVHIGEDDGSVLDTRKIVGLDRFIGVSCYNNLRRGEVAVADGADYVAFGSFFESSVKPQARRADAGLLPRARTLDVPIVAIGGITAGNAGELARAGADAVAVISAVFGSGDIARIEQDTRALCDAMAIGRR